MYFYLVLLAYCVLFENSSGTAQDEFFSFGSNVGDSALAGSNGETSDPIVLMQSFSFYGTNHNTLFASFYLDNTCNLHDKVEE